MYRDAVRTSAGTASSNAAWIVQRHRKKRIVAVDMHKRYDPDHLRIRHDIKNRIGEPLYGVAYLEEPLEVSTSTFKWVEQSDWAAFLAEKPENRSCTSICLKIID